MPAKPAKPAKRRRTKEPETHLRPLKIVGHLVAKEVDEHGETVGEVPISQITIFAPSFDKVKEIVEENWEQITRAGGRDASDAEASVNPSTS